jgi:hypothetical protein
MKVLSQKDTITGETRYTIIIKEEEFMACTLDPKDRMLLRECEESSSVADKFLCMEMIARKIEANI